ncbi:M66 family metalloprotease [Kribbella monticola]|uniref:M66 family metalloprotease n=1 Tax=Kribbella monticola TaxID=2185285 RepID=UPI000DD4BD29|nr:M66 family metalloprotease [Kribbella monticola]
MPRFNVSSVFQRLADADWLNPFLAGIYIDGVEVTQVIQYRKAAEHLTDPADRGADNSIRLVADKPAYVRVYVHALFADVYGVQGTVVMQRMKYGVWVDSGTLVAQYPGVVTAPANPDYATERRSLGNSLNFVIPAALMRGTFRLRVTVQAASNNRYRAEHFQTVDASLLQKLKVRMIPIKYSGDDLNGNHVDLPLPTLADLQSTVVDTVNWYPVSHVPELSVAGQMNWFVPLSGAILNGKCPDVWNSILAWMYLVKLADGDKPGWLYYGMLPSAIPLDGTGGCGGGGAGVGTGPVGQSSSMGHELGHVLSFQHSPCGQTNDPYIDPNYPAYEPYDTAQNRMASIGEYGFDITGPTVLRPGIGRDFMSYCFPRWPSLYQYQRMLQHEHLNPSWVQGPADARPPNVQLDLDGPIPHYIPDPPPDWGSAQVRPMLVLLGRMVEGQLEVHHVITLDTTPSQDGIRLPGTSVHLIDGQGQLLAQAPVYLVETLACGGCGGGGCGGCGDKAALDRGVIRAMVPVAPEGGTLRIVRDDEEVWMREPADAPPWIEGLQAEATPDALRVSWHEEVYVDKPLRLLRWSGDDGQTWQSLAAGLGAGEATVSVTPMSAGSALVQLMISDGFHTVVSDSVRVDVPWRAPDAAILAPASGATVRAGSLIRLWALASDASGRPLSGEQLRWELDGQPAGTGTEVFAELLDFEGDHRVVLTADDGSSRTVLTTKFTASGNGQPPHRHTR